MSNRIYVRSVRAEAANASKKKGNNVKYLIVKPSGHFEIITPGTKAWPDIEKAIISLFK